MEKDNAQQVLRYLNTVQEADLQSIYRNVEFSYYCNWQKHLGDVMARLVDNNMVVRIRRGVYAINKDYRPPAGTKKTENPQQGILF